MKSILFSGILVFILIIGLSPVVKGKSIREIYPGRLLRTQTLSRDRVDTRITVEFAGIIRNSPAFLFRKKNIILVRTQNFYEKLLVIREENDTDGGQRLPLAGEEIPGEIKKHKEIEDAGILRGATFQFLGDQQITNVKGIILDRNQLVLNAFDNLRKKQVTIRFDGGKIGSTTLVLTRKQLRQALQVRFDYVGHSSPKACQISYHWDRPFYQAGSSPKLTVTLQNTSQKSPVFLLRGGRSVSRWPWLDGKMFYFGELAPGKTDSFTRIFSVPENIPAGTYYLRIGFSEWSGTKPQLPVRLKIRAKNEEGTVHGPAPVMIQNQIQKEQ